MKRLALLLLLLSFPALADSNYIYRNSGLNAGVAVKAPVAAATTGNITLSGAQTIDAVSITAGKRVLVKDQSIAALNGIYDASLGSWTRAADWDGPGDVVHGSLITVAGGTQAGLWQLTTADPVTIGTTNVVIGELSLGVGDATNATNIGTTAASTNASFYVVGVASSSSGNQAATINSGVSFNPSTGTVSATKFTGTNAALSGTTTVGNLTVTGTCSGCSGTTSLSLSGIIAATTTNSIDNGAFAQTWAWQTLGANTGLTLTTTNATTGILLALSEITTGAGKALSSTLTGLSNTGYAGFFTNSATTGYAVYASGRLGVSGNSVLAGTTSVNTLTTANAAMAGTTTVNNLTVTGTCTGCGATGGGLVLLNTVNASAAAQIAFSSTYITSTYNKYQVECDSIYTSDGGSIAMQISTNNGSGYLSSAYVDMGYTVSSGGTGAVISTDPGRLSISGGKSTSSTSTVVSQLSLKFSKPSASQAFNASWEMFVNAATSYDVRGSGVNTGTTAINNIKFYDVDGGNITGNCHLFGIAGT